MKWAIIAFIETQHAKPISFHLFAQNSHTGSPFVGYFSRIKLREINYLLNIIQLLNDSVVQIQISLTWGMVHVPCFNTVCIVCPYDGKLTQSLDGVFNIFTLCNNATIYNIYTQDHVT